MSVIVQLFDELVTVLQTMLQILPYLVGYVALIMATTVIWRVVKRFLTPKSDFGSLKTVTFGDASARTRRAACR